MADIFKEVEEDLRRESAAKLWKKHGGLVIGLAVALVLGVAGLQAWRAYDLNRRQELSDRFASALEAAGNGETAAALKALNALSDTARDGYPGLAAFEEARLRAEQGDVAAAIAIWDRMAQNGELGTGLRSVALLFSVLHQIDSGEPKALLARLEPLAAPGHPFRASALELSALLALRQGDGARARELYGLIADDASAPAGTRGRAAQMLAALKE